MGLSSNNNIQSIKAVRPPTTTDSPVGNNTNSSSQPSPSYYTPGIARVASSKITFGTTNNYNNNISNTLPTTTMHDAHYTSPSLLSQGNGGGALNERSFFLHTTTNTHQQQEPFCAPSLLLEEGKDPEEAAAEAGAPKNFFCSICLHIMREPVMLPTGQSYDKRCIQKWLSHGQAQGKTGICPVTGLPLKPPITMTPNWALSSSITEWAELNAPWLMDVDKKLKPAAGSSVLLPMKKDPLFIHSSSPFLLDKQGLSYDNYNKNDIKADMLAMRYFGRMNQQPMTRPASAPVRGMTLHEIEPSLSTPNDEIGGEHDPELALAIRQQQAELDRIASQRSMMNGTRSGGSFVATGNGNGNVFLPPPPPPPGYGPTSSSSSAANGNRKNNVFKSWITWELVALSAAYITLFLMSLSNADWTIEELSLNPWVGPSQAALVSTGAQSLALIKGWEEWWRLFTSPFLTAGLIQIIGVLVTVWSFGKYLEKALPYAAVTVPCIYLLGAVMGAMASANLDSSYVVCGAAAGVCSLLGGVWADQLLNIKKYTGKLFTFTVLILVTGMFIATSLMPLVDVWYQSAALLTGFFVTVTILLLPKVGRGRRHNGWWVALQIVCATLVIGAGTAAIVGLVLPTQLGDTVDFLQEASCLQIKYWECVPDSNSCTAEMNENNSGNAVLTCANGMSYQVPAANLAVRTSNGGYAIGKWDLSDLCPQFCSQEEIERGGGGSNVDSDDGRNDAFVGDDGLSDVGDNNIGGTVVPAPGSGSGLIGAIANLLSHDDNVDH